MEKDIDTSIVPGASYHVYEGALTKSSPITCSPGQVSKRSKYVTFYTFDGNPITTIKHNFEFTLMNSKLDTNAPVPKPASYRRIWMPAFKLGIENVIVEAGYIVLFHDKNEHRISFEVLNTANEDINSWEEYDLSEAIEEESDFRLKDVDMDLIDEHEEFCQDETSNFNLTDTQIIFSRKTKIDFGVSGINFDLTKSNMMASRINFGSSRIMTESRIMTQVKEMEALIEEKKEEEEKEEEKTEEEKEEEAASSCVIF